MRITTGKGLGKSTVEVNRDVLGFLASCWRRHWIGARMKEKFGSDKCKFCNFDLK